MPLEKCGRVRKSYKKSSPVRKLEVLRILRVIMENKSNQIPNSTTSITTVDSGSGVEGAVVQNINADNFNDFFNTGRIGRRNALPDILSIACATTSTADLPEKFDALTTADVIMPTNKPPDATIASTSSNEGPNSIRSYNDANVNPS